MLEFVAEDRADDGAGRLPERVVAALTPRYTVVPEASRHTRQVWLDTFDWRLHTAGLVLRQVSGSRSTELVLTTCAGDPALSAAVPRAIRWPHRLPALPAGPLRDRLEDVAGVRALLPLARTEGTQTRLRVLDSEFKTVARITVENVSLTRPSAVPLPPRLLVTPVRGYSTAAHRAARLLGAADGFAPASEPAFLTVLGAAGRRPGDYTGTVGVTLRASMPAREALVAVLLRLAATMDANAGFVIRDVDPEFLHDLRVAVRRTRSALKLAGDALPAGMAARFAPEFKWLGDLTTPTRDLDVYLYGFGEMCGGVGAATPGDLEPFRGYLAAQRAAEFRRLVRGLRSARYTGLTADWRAALETDAAGPGGQSPRIASLAGDRIALAYRRVVKRGSAITTGAPADGPPAEDMHALRKRCKELRYLLEFFGSLYEPAALRRAVKELKGLQDCLGDFQDAEVQQTAIRQYAAWAVDQHGRPAQGKRAGGRQMEGQPTAAGLAATLLALGELTGGLHARQDRARADVAGRLGRFKRAGILSTLGIQA